MNILIVAATPKEALPLTEKLSSGAFPGVRLLITGIGMVNTAFQLGKAFGTECPDLAINLGIAGSFHRNFSIGETVEVVRERFSEVGAEDHDELIGLREMGFPLLVNKEGEKVWEILENSRPSALDLPKVSGVTVNRVHGNEQSIANLVERVNPDIETMESAAFFQACLLQNVPFMAFRGISNFVEPRNLRNWRIDKAIESVNENVIKLLHELT